MRLSLTIASVALALALGACADDDAPSKKPVTSNTSSGGGSAPAHGGDFYAGRTLRWAYPESREPRAKLPTGPPPKRLTTTTLRPGTGEPAKRGDKVVVNHIGLHYANGRKHDTTYGGNAVPIEMVVGEGSFIKGFERGVQGMRVGERRMLIVPPRLGYGSNGYGRKGADWYIAPGATIVYIVDLEAIVKRKAAG